MNFRRCLVICLFILMPVSGFAAEIYGRILTTRNQPASDAIVSSSCGSSTQANEQGSYRLTVSGPGKCTISVQYDGSSTNSVTIYVSDSGTRVNLALQPKSGGWLLTRS